MPKIETPESKFIAFLQNQLGEPVSVPKHATDVMRVVRFPGLERREAEPQQPVLDFYGQTPPQEPERAPVQPEQSFPEGF